jgi:hypothetical protein
MRVHLIPCCLAIGMFGSAMGKMARIEEMRRERMMYRRDLSLNSYAASNATKPFLFNTTASSSESTLLV